MGADIGEGFGEVGGVGVGGEGFLGFLVSKFSFSRGRLGKRIVLRKLGGRDVPIGLGVDSRMPLATLARFSGLRARRATA